MGFRTPDLEPSLKPLAPLVERLFVIDDELATEITELAALIGDSPRDWIRDQLVLACDEVRAVLERDRGA